MQFAVTDLFVVGLGFDLVGGWLLARGLIAKPSVIVRRNTSYWGSNAPSAFAAAEDRVDGLCGVVSLLLGFALQAVGYTVDLADGGDVAHSASRAFTALVLLVVAAGVALVVWRLIRPRMLRSLLVEMAHWKATSADKPAERGDRADPNDLAAWAPVLGVARAADENNHTYAKRAFKLTDAHLIQPPEDASA